MRADAHPQPLGNPLQRHRRLLPQPPGEEWLARASEQVGAHPLRLGTAGGRGAKAERLVRGELAKLGWAEEELVRRRKGDPL